MAATFCMNETFTVPDRRRALPPADYENNMSNQQQSLLAGEYADRRPQMDKSLDKAVDKLAAFKSQLQAQQKTSGNIQQQQPQEQQQQQKEDETSTQQPEWPEQEGVDAKILFAVDPPSVKIGREIGKGAFSVVYAGDYRGQHVAVKCQPKDAEGNIPAFVMREVQVLRQLRHPRLLQFAGAADNVRTKQVWILSEYLNNGDVDLLLKSIRSGKKVHIGWHRMVRIALDAAQGIEFLQKRHIVHRDIKSSNILLDDQHRSKLCDFGFAVEIKPVASSVHGAVDAEENKQRRKSYCGTDAYMAPEMFLDEDYDQSVDIFSFGVVLMEMLCCRVANADGFVQRLPQYKFRVLLPEFRDALPASCPPTLAALAEECVSFEPSERPNIHKIVVNEPFFDEESIDNYVLAQPATPAPYHEGLILKRNRRGKRSWGEKWFIVDHDQLHYTDMPPRWKQKQQLNPDWRCGLPPISSLSLRDCRIWKTMEMPELRFNVIDSNWKIKRELQAVSKSDLEMWMELINQGIDYANEIYAREHDIPNNSTSASTGTSASGSNTSRPSRNKSKKGSKSQEQRPTAKSEAMPVRKARRSRGASAAAKFEVPPEMPETEEDRADEIYLWLKAIGFQRYTPMLKEKGFDSLDFIRETGIEMEDLNFVGIKEPNARNAIRSAARTLRGDDDD
ncbi:hypothetical protein BBO99_00000380 [Phytophthora kernoviae]|uniref:Protein kinase domain-containing protein n=2 Tax=Phytophthora kernoviae TaxID=325452 RepID=A0A421H2X2_9STRA|nr:hypothetical protein G195_001238 [Phytophthora kernoviae 00238/432]RLN14521.1 hypothetical protein BBI17_000437 [Phytophthora kernoviae]RLN85656.1 hypothetical protein BBO99_00000380 [Phytophthora kernoviae]